MNQKHHSDRNDTPPGGGSLSPIVHRFAKRLGFYSLRGRYLYLTVLIFLFLAAASWFAQSLVATSTEESTQNISQRQELAIKLGHINDDVWEAQALLQDYMLVPNPAQRISLLKILDHLNKDADKLLENPWIKANTTRKKSAQEFREYSIRLRQEAEEIMRVRADARRLFPAMPILIGKMDPADSTFLTYVGLALDDLKGQHSADEILASRLFSESRYVWAMMTRAFRMYVANRFGIFPGLPEDNMKIHADQVEFYAEMLGRQLNTLASLDRQDQLGLQQSDALSRMRAAYEKWRVAYKEAKVIYNSEHWRTDVPLMRKQIQPHLAASWSALSSLQRALEEDSTKDVNTVGETADSLSRAIWFISAVSLLLFFAGYLVFEFSIRHPVARVAKALKDEALGREGETLEKGNTAETQNLVEAFDHMREQVRSRQQRLETILDNAAEGIITFDHQGLIRSFNHAAETLFGYPEAEIQGKDLSFLIPPVEAPDRREGYLEHFMRSEIQRLLGHEGEVIGRQKDGTRFPMALKISEIVLEGEPLYTALVADISERKALMEHLKDMAEHDGLTGLYNRTYFQQELERVVERARRAKECFALLYIDLDNFKYVNDTLGHAAGDKLLVEVASALNRRARKGDLIVRLGGDEFTVLLYNAHSDQVSAIAESFRQTLENYSFKHAGERVDIGCSIGVTSIGPAAQSASQVLSQADIACHIAKRGGRNRIHVFSAADESSMTVMSLDMGWSRRIREAIEHNRFALACQPIVHTQSGEIESFEVLIRMLDDADGLILPGGFLPSAERFGLSVDIDRWVIVNAIETLAQQRHTTPKLRYALNLSGQTLTRPEICNLIMERLKTTGLDPSALTFEVTETVAIADMAVAETFLRKLQQIGCRTSLDDFGSGMSSFAYLRDLPIDSVKIDGRFVKNLAVNPVDQAMVKAMNEIAHALGKQTVAEFVENEDSLKLLKTYGVDYVQGYYLGRPDIILPCKAITEHAADGVVCLMPARLSSKTG